jgi:hypothetical protein
VVIRVYEATDSDVEWTDLYSFPFPLPLTLSPVPVRVAVNRVHDRISASDCTCRGL